MTWGPVALALVLGCAAPEVAAPLAEQTETRPTAVHENAVAQTDPEDHALSPDLTLARAHIAKSTGAPLTDIDVEAVRRVDVPGVTVWTADVEPGTRGTHYVGVVRGGVVVTKPAEAMKVVLDAWGYGPELSAEAVDVARALGALEPHAEETRPLVKDKKIARLKDAWRPHVFLPRATAKDGGVVLEYWNTSGEPPLWLTTMTIDAARNVRWTTKSIDDF